MTMPHVCTPLPRPSVLIPPVGWCRELGADEVCENYMDAKFGGEDADMAESQRS